MEANVHLDETEFNRLMRLPQFRLMYEPEPAISFKTFKRLMTKHRKTKKQKYGR
jgi:hypothetical protein